MSREEIVTKLSLKLVNIAASPSEIVFALSMQSVLIELADRLGEQALKLTPKELFQARDAVRIAIGKSLNTQEVIVIGLDSWAETSSGHPNPVIHHPRKEHSK